jgi:hypothetical protein
LASNYGLNSQLIHCCDLFFLGECQILFIKVKKNLFRKKKVKKI